MRSVSCAPLVGPFADRLLRLDLPDLDAERRGDAVRFACRRIDDLPSVMHLGVLAIATVVRALVALPGRDAIVRTLGRLALPLVGEYPRLIRSLAYAYVWETWPATTPTGGAMGDGTGAAA